MKKWKTLNIKTKSLFLRHLFLLQRERFQTLINVLSINKKYKNLIPENLNKIVYVGNRKSFKSIEDI
jgi:hypothetical protein